MLVYYNKYIMMQLIHIVSIEKANSRILFIMEYIMLNNYIYILKSTISLTF